MDVPIFRSDAQFRLLGELFTNPGVETTIGELAERTTVAQPTVSRQVTHLSEHGLVHCRHEGNRTLVSANLDSPLADDLRSLLTKLYGPIAAIRETLAEVPGVEEAFIFGTWAARWHGRSGPPPNDVDLMVIGEVAYDDVWAEAAALSERLGIDVNPVMRTRDEWEGDATSFVRGVKSAPQVDVTPDPPSQDAA
jgi:DNA-binding transcriptional ArsR family regulator